MSPLKERNIAALRPAGKNAAVAVCPSAPVLAPRPTGDVECLRVGVSDVRLRRKMGGSL